MYSNLPPFQVYNLVGLKYIHTFENTTTIKAQISVIPKLCPCHTAIHLAYSWPHAATVLLFGTPG